MMSTFGSSAAVEAVHAAYRQAEQLQHQGRLEQALAIYQQLASKHPRWAFGHFGAGAAHAAAGRFEQARKHIRKAIALQDDQGAFYAKLAQVLSRLDERQGAIEAIDKAIGLEPANASFVVEKAVIYRANGDAQTAMKLLEPLIEGGNRDEHLVRQYASLCGVLGDPAKGVQALEPLAQKTHEDPIVTASHWFVLAHLYNQLGRYEAAYDAATRGAELRRDPYNPEARDALLAARAKAWSGESMPNLARSRVTSDKPVFIVGMPRSGTTLVEQILAAHPDVYGAGELINIFSAVDELATVDDQEGPGLDEIVAGLKPATLDRVGRKILRDMEKQAPRGSKAKRITDKLPLNFQHLGLIEQLFPSARVINCTRHPLDNFISCYLLDFEGVGAHAYTYSPEHFAHFYGLYEKYMAHWREVCSLPILDVSYEALIDDQRGQSERLIEFLALDWDEACMAFYEADRAVNTASSEQVRRPVYRSSARRYKNYEPALGPIRRALAAHGVVTPGDGS